MRSNKHSKHSKEKKQKVDKTGKMSKFSVFTRVWSILYFLTMAVFAGVVIYFDLLPMKHLCIVLAIVVFISALIFPALYFRRFKKSRKIMALIMSILLMMIYSLGIIYMTGTLDFFSKITDIGTQTKDYYVIVRDDSDYKELKDIKDKKVQTYLTNDLNYSKAKNQLKDKVAVKYEMIENLSELAEGLIDKKHDVIFVSSGHYDTICEKNSAFKSESRILYTIKVKVKSEDISKRVDVTKESFNILVSGIDVEGSIDVTSRSDVNMIVTVNPKTHKILLTSIPRDYAIKLTSKDNADDKLTHTGIYGIQETVASVEELMGININYYTKVNYTTVTKFVDAIDGIDVTSDYTFTTSGMEEIYTFYEGENHLDGSRALAFARERHSFEEGDLQRNKNQQKILSAMIKKASSSTTILNSYTDILKSVQDNVEINMTSTDIKKLVKMQLSDMPSWTIETQNLDGEGTTKQCYSTGDYYVYVMEGTKEHIVTVVDKIIYVMNEKMDTDTDGE